jgi:hypothetical protein
MGPRLRYRIKKSLGRGCPNVDGIFHQKDSFDAAPLHRNGRSLVDLIRSERAQAFEHIRAAGVLGWHKRIAYAHARELASKFQFCGVHDEGDPRRERRSSSGRAVQSAALRDMASCCSVSARWRTRPCTRAHLDSWSAYACRARMSCPALVRTKLLIVAQAPTTAGARSAESADRAARLN